jgi:hypothetical protein
MTQAEALALVTAERTRQAGLWDRDHRHGHGDCSSLGVPEAVKAAVLAEECGEVARAWLDGDRDGLRRELVQVAAVAVAWLESLSPAVIADRARDATDRSQQV